MNDVLPKPFTKEGLLQMLHKHLGHLKKPGTGMDGAPPPQGPPMQPIVHGANRHSIKVEDSPQKSPTTTSNWSSPAQVPGVSPVTEEYMSTAQGHVGGYGMNTTMMTGMPYQANPVPMPMQMGGQRPPQGQHRRQISDISGGEEFNANAKRQHMYSGQMQGPA